MGNFGMTAVAQPITGFLSDTLDKSGGQLMTAAVTVAAVALFLASLSFVYCSRHYAALKE
jgi:hypothetical protein